MKRVIAIVRVSTGAQAAEDRHGLGRQVADIEAAAAMHGLTIARTLQIVESGSSAFNREDFKEVFRDLAAPDVHGIIVSSIDRLVRPGFLGDLAVFDPLQRLKKILYAGSQVIDLQGESDWLMSGFFGLSAGLEKRAILKRTLGGKERMRAQGRHAGGPQTLPAGLAYDKVTGKWSYVEPAAGRVKKCFNLLFEGLSFEEIAKRVGLPTGRGVGYLLRNTAWKAIRTFEANSLRAVPLEMPMGIEPLIPPARWAAAQVILDQKTIKTRARRRPTKTPALGLGLLRCKYGRHHYLRRDYRRNQHDLYYCASGYSSGRVNGKHCGAASIRRSVADRAIAAAVAELCDAKTVLSVLKTAAERPAPRPRETKNRTRNFAVWRRAGTPD